VRRRFCFQAVKCKHCGEFLGEEILIRVIRHYKTGTTGRAAKTKEGAKWLKGSRMLVIIAVGIVLTWVFADKLHVSIGPIQLVPTLLVKVAKVALMLTLQEPI